MQQHVCVHSRTDTTNMHKDFMKETKFAKLWILYIWNKINEFYISSYIFIWIIYIYHFSKCTAQTKLAFNKDYAIIVDKTCLRGGLVLFYETYVKAKPISAGVSSNHMIMTCRVMASPATIFTEDWNRTDIETLPTAAYRYQFDVNLNTLRMQNGGPYTRLEAFTGQVDRANW